MEGSRLSAIDHRITIMNNARLERRPKENLRYNIPIFLSRTPTMARDPQMLLPLPTHHPLTMQVPTAINHSYRDHRYACGLVCLVHITERSHQPDAFEVPLPPNPSPTEVSLTLVNVKVRSPLTHATQVALANSLACLVDHYRCLLDRVSRMENYLAEATKPRER